MTLLDRLLKRSKQQKSKSLEKEINDGSQAGALLRDTIFAEVVDTMRQNIINEWLISPLRDVEGQEKLRLMIELLNSIVKNIEGLYQTGILAQKQKDAENKQAKKVV